MTVIEVNGLTKRYGGRPAADGISFAVEQGEIFGILDPNGAGKTTTVECVIGLRRPDSGRISVLGLNPLRDRNELRELVGAQLQESHPPGASPAGTSGPRDATISSVPFVRPLPAR